MVSRSDNPKYPIIKECNLPDVDIFVQPHPQEYTNWNRLDMRPSQQDYIQGIPWNFSTWNSLDTVLPMHNYNVSGVIQYQEPLSRWPPADKSSLRNF